MDEQTDLIERFKIHQTSVNPSVNTNRNGTTNASLFCYPQITCRYLQESFNWFDNDKDGYIDLEDLRQVCGENVGLDTIAEAELRGACYRYGQCCAQWLQFLLVLSSIRFLGVNVNRTFSVQSVAAIHAVRRIVFSFRPSMPIYVFPHDVDIFCMPSARSLLSVSRLGLHHPQYHPQGPLEGLVSWNLSESRFQLYQHRPLQVNTFF